jgi:hypothetical protein
MSLEGLHVPSPIAETMPVFDWRDPLLFLLGVGHVTSASKAEGAEIWASMLPSTNAVLDIIEEEDLCARQMRLAQLFATGCVR